MTTQTATQSDNDKELKEAFEEFKDTSSQHSFDDTQQSTQNSDNTDTTQQQNNQQPQQQVNNLSFADEFKVKMFIGFIFMFLDGIHAFVYQFISKYKLDKDALSLDKDDKEDLEEYFKTPRVAAILNKIPTELIGIAHMEYIYFNKFRDWTEEQKEAGTLKLKKKRSREEEEEEDEEMEEDENEEVEEKPKKKAAKKVAKKKSVKKAAKKSTNKTSTKKEEKKKDEQGKS